MTNKQLAANDDRIQLETKQKAACIGQQLDKKWFVVHDGRRVWTLACIF